MKEESVTRCSMEACNLMSGGQAAGTLLLRELTSRGRKRLGTQGLQVTAGAPELLGRRN